jgi:hypothetical protein
MTRRIGGKREKQRVERIGRFEGRTLRTEQGLEGLESLGRRERR